MPVVESTDFPREALTPICKDCGISACYDIGRREFIEDITFWANWRCEYCNPDYHLKKKS